VKDFSNGVQDESAKNNSLYVRAIRSFQQNIFSLMEYDLVHWNPRMQLYVGNNHCLILPFPQPSQRLLPRPEHHVVLPARHAQHNPERCRPEETQPHNGNKSHIRAVVGSHALYDPDSFPANCRSRDVQQSHNGMRLLQCNDFFDFLDHLGYFRRGVGIGEIHQQDLLAVTDDELRCCHLFLSYESLSQYPFLTAQQMIFPTNSGLYHEGKEILAPHF